jgi:hypothetical protein
MPVYLDLSAPVFVAPKWPNQTLTAVKKHMGGKPAMGVACWCF